jgi:hypothetical protein
VISVANWVLEPVVMAIRHRARGGGGLPSVGVAVDSTGELAMALRGVGFIASTSFRITLVYTGGLDFSTGPSLLERRVRVRHRRRCGGAARRRRIPVPTLLILIEQRQEEGCGVIIAGGSMLCTFVHYIER